ncbi:PKD domain-containing protein [Reichenbachiella agarivorans]|uniref:PKD domain-containing protein n=1 Tax=Reichenbachiella agarivorans TaxID=2979464 RepID=A0ABY6CU23_9BACT|nr:PKD domain-containing protein [Reichenbachiella agarivorans]UXP32948.1 PKD domain-containing protein [Reichenbachiella agarivorans]
MAIRNNGVPYVLTLDDNLATLENITILADGESFSNLPRDVETIWMGTDLIALFTNSSGSTNITRAIWSNGDLTQEPAYDLITGMTTISQTNGLDIIQEGNNYYALVGKNSSNLLSILNFGNDMTSVPSVSSFNISGISNINGISLQKECNTWVGLVTSRSSNKLVKLTWNSGLANTPTVQEITVSSIDWSAPTKVKLVVDQGYYYAFVQLDNSDIFRFDFGYSMTASPTISQLTGLSSGGYGIDITQNSNKQWRLFSIDYSSDEGLYAVGFESTCDRNLLTSIEDSPTFSLETSGIYELKLVSFDENGNFNTSSDFITVSNDTAPTISFSSSDNECIGQSNTFAPIDAGGLSYEWSFDGGNTVGSTDSNPTHTFSQVGDSIVTLTVTDGTCSNFVQDTISIYPVPPTPSFTPSAAPYCTNAEIIYTNSSDETGYEGATLSYLWDYGDGNSETQKDGSNVYVADGDYTIELTMSIPGCSTSHTDDIQIIAGPAADFVMDKDCFGETTEFTNVTIGTNLINPAWDFGDGLGSATVLNPSYTYGSTGEFDVTLAMENSDGCHSEITRTIRINGTPEVAFVNTPGCQGQEVQFTDESTPGDVLNNLQSWVWDFDGLGDSGAQNPSFAFDEMRTYQVSLTVTNTGNCSNTATQAVIIRPTPLADFNIDLGCISTATEFVDMSQSQDDNQISSWYWVINGQEYFTQDVSKTFSTAGTYQATLSVTPTNLCVAVVEKEFTVFNKPIAAFSEVNNCDNETTIFTDQTLSEGPAIVSRVWDFDGKGSSNGTQTAFDFGTADDYDVSLRVTDELGCISTTSQTVTIHSSPTAAFEVSNEFGGAPLTVDYINNSNNGLTYLWDFGIANHTSQEENPSYTYTEIGDYVTQLIAYNEFCSDSAYIDILVADPLLDLQLTKIETKATGNTVQIWLTAYNGSTFNLDGFDIQIDFESQNSIFESYDELLPRDRTVTFPLSFHLPAEDNNVDYLCVTLRDREPSLTDLDLLNNKGCVNFEQDLVIQKPYPNPVPAGNDLLYIQAILPSKSPVQLYMISATGSILYSETYTEISSGLNTFVIDTHDTKGGMYFVKIVYGGKEKTQKVIKL